MQKASTILISSLTLSLLVAGRAFAIDQYTIQNLGDFTPLDINDSSQITGDGPGNTGGYVALWQNGNLTQLTPPGLTNLGGGTSINNAGQIVGSGYEQNGIDVGNYIEQGFVWDPTHGFTLLSTSFQESSYSAAINNNGQAAGAITPIDGSGPSVATIWNSDGSRTYLPSLSNGDSQVHDINDSGQAVGSAGAAFWNSWLSDPAATIGTDHAVLWENGAIIDLTPNDPQSYAYKINDRGQVIGDVIDPITEQTDLFEWDALHGITILPKLGDVSDVGDINDEGQIVGFFLQDDDSVSLACIWQDEAVYDLNNLIPADSGWTLVEADAINNLGQVVGIGTYDGQTEGFLLTPVPEPAIMPLLAGISLLARRGRK